MGTARRKKAALKRQRKKAQRTESAPTDSVHPTDKMLEWLNANQLQEKRHMPKVALFGVDGHVVLKSMQGAPHFETDALLTLCYRNDHALPRIISTHQPHVFVTVGDACEDFLHLYDAPWQVRSRWLHFAQGTAWDVIGSSAFSLYINVCCGKLKEGPPLVSVYTPTYKSGDRFQRAFRSMRAQTYTNWEWVLVDDSDDDGETLAMLHEHAAHEYRMRVYKPTAHCGVIGEVKYQASMLCSGKYLVELDHDDEFTVDALQMVVDGFARFPDAGFLTTDWCEVFEEDDVPRTYGDGFAHGLEHYRDEVYQGRALKVVEQALMSSKAIRGLVAAPNHLRAWTRQCYLELQGHARHLHIADDMELMVRTFLHTRMVQVRRLGYIQYFSKRPDGNTQLARNKDIQRHVRYLRQVYDRAIHERFVELGCDDYAWNESGQYSDMNVPNPAVVPHVSYVME
jgi:hypothetical protein